MSEYTVLKAVGQTLKELVFTGIEHDGQIFDAAGQAIFNSKTQINFDSPGELLRNTATQSGPWLSLFLYRVIENGEMKNRPLLPIDAHRLKYPPLTVNLYYLVTANTGKASSDQIVLGKVLQIFYDNSEVKGTVLQTPLSDPVDELRLILNPLPMEDITKLWSAFMQPYRLSLSYEVKVVFVDSERETAGEQVRRKRMEFVPTV